MTLQEFTAKMNPLLEKGRKTYTGSVLDLIFKEVKNLSSLDFERLVAFLNGSQRFAPLVPEFRKAIQDLGLKPDKKFQIVDASFTPRQTEDHVYHLRENVWANNDYILVQGSSVKECGFIIKADYPNNPVVEEDDKVRSSKIQEIKNHIKNGTYPRYQQSKINEFKKLDFENFFPGDELA